MGVLFDSYQKHINLGGVPPDSQKSFIDETNGHEASFMVLLKVFEGHRPTVDKWSLVMEQSKTLRNTYMNGTNTKIKQTLKEMSVDAIPQKLLVITAVFQLHRQIPALSMGIITLIPTQAVDQAMVPRQVKPVSGLRAVHIISRRCMAEIMNKLLAEDLGP